MIIGDEFFHDNNNNNEFKVRIDVKGRYVIVNPIYQNNINNEYLYVNL